VAITNFYELYWKLFNIAGGGTEADVTKVLDSIVRSDRSKLDQYFSNAIDQIAFDTEDWDRLRAFLIDLFTANRALITNSAGISDPHFLSNDDLDELFRSFGYPESTRLKNFDNNPLDSKVALFLDLVNLYKIKGTPRSILEILQYYGIPKLDIFEFWLQKEDPSTLIFKGDVIAGTSINPSPITLPFDLLTEGDPHWMMSESQILNLDSINKINLPSKSPYFAVQPIVEIGVENAILVRIVQDQYFAWESSGPPKVLPPQNAEITILGLTVSLLELYLLTLYSFQKSYEVGTAINDFACYDGTATTIAEQVAEYDLLVSDPILRARYLSELTNQNRTAFNSTPGTPFSGITYPDGISSYIPPISKWDQYLDLFTRKKEEHFLYNYPGATDNAAETALNLINPTLISDLNSLGGDNNKILQSLLKDLADWTKNNLGFGFVNLGYIFFGLAQLFEDLKPVINFFKPYRARLIVLELLQFKNKLTESIPLNDAANFSVDFELIDYMTGNSSPCCDKDTDATAYVCIDTTAGTYYSRDTYDCGSYHDIGAVTDISKPLQINIDQYLCDSMRCPPGCPSDTTGSIVATYQGVCDRLSGIPPASFDGTSAMRIDPDSTGCTELIPMTCENVPIVFSEQIATTIEQIEDLALGSESITVVFPDPMSSSSYVLNVNMFNEIDGLLVSMYGLIITSKTVNGFTVKFSSPIDSGNYKLSWNVNADSTVSGIEVLNYNSDIYEVSFPAQPSSDYAITTSIVNENDSNPSMYEFVVTEKSNDGFTMQFNIPIDSTNYEINFNIYDSTASVVPNGIVNLPLGTIEEIITIPNQTNDKYSLGLTIINTVDASASIYSYIVSEKNSDNFKVRFSSLIDSTNYYLSWAIPFTTEEVYLYRQDSGFRMFDTMGTFDCTHGFDSVEISISVLTQLGVILQEDGFWLLQENGAELLLE